MAVVDISQVKISTVSVEVKTLSLNKKQMTLSFFRQLQNKEIIDWQNSKLNGIPWGKVNYFWSNDDGEFIHIIWQKNTEIFRSLIRIDDMREKYTKDIEILTKDIAHMENYPTPFYIKEKIPKSKKMIEKRIAYVDEFTKNLSLIDDLKDLPQLFIAV